MKAKVQPPPQPEQWLSVRQAAQLCGLSQAYIYAACQRYELTHYRTPSPLGVRSKILIPFAKLDEWRKRVMTPIPAIPVYPT